MSLNSISGTPVKDKYDAMVSANAAKTQKSTDSNSVKNDTTVKAAADGVIYEKADDTKNAAYSANKMSASDRAALVQQLKQDQETRQNNLINIVQQIIGKQAKSYSMANDSDSMWKFLAGGNFTVDADTKAQAQKDISDDGYYGVKQTSQRLFDFASALAGDDVEKMKKMQEAMQKGFNEATKSWGKSLPDICQNTIDAANKMFDEYYKSKGNTLG